MKKDAQPAAELVAQSATGHASNDSGKEKKKATVIPAWALSRFIYQKVTMGDKR